MTTTTEASHASQLVSTREVPWMKLGKLTEKPMHAAEAAELGGLNFQVEKWPLYAGPPGQPHGSATLKPINERVAIFRTDTAQWLGIMSKTYPLLQYSEAFDFMDTVAPEYVACGALKGGRQGFMVVQAPENFHVMSEVDPHDLYVVLRTSHDGSRAIEVSVMPLRHRCMNQLTLNTFASGIPHRWSIKHTTTMAAKLKDAQLSLSHVGQYAKRFAEVADKLMNVKVTDEKATTILRAVLPDRPRRDDQVSTILNSWHTSETVGFDWSGWGLVNAVSEYFDWGRAGGSPESRFVGALQGQTTNAINKVAGRILSRV
jgi:phage/plasmid-like protein (TIGR03299 family)